MPFLATNQNDQQHSKSIRGSLKLVPSHLSWASAELPQKLYIWIGMEVREGGGGLVRSGRVHKNVSTMLLAVACLTHYGASGCPTHEIGEARGDRSLERRERAKAGGSSGMLDRRRHFAVGPSCCWLALRANRFGLSKVQAGCPRERTSN